MSDLLASERAEQLPRLLAGLDRRRPVQLAQHHDRIGGLPRLEPARLLDELERSGLRGRGGAGFPVVAKIRAVAGCRAPRVVANGAEGEPASRKDRLLMSRAPHLVLDGAALAATLVSAEEAIVCVKRDAGSAVAALQAAGLERRALGLDRARLTICETSSDYVSGEETALVHQLNGGPAKPTFIPPRPFEAGVAGSPTLVQNVETLAHIALIARFGAGWFRELGTADDPGSVLITLSGAVKRPGVYEIAAGTRLGDLLQAAGGAADSLQAFLVGGYAGRWYPVETGVNLSLGHQDLRAHGATLGPGVVIALPRGACAVGETAAVARYLAGESSGQCGPCTHGLAAIAEAMTAIASGQGPPGTQGWVDRWCEDVVGRGACHHPDGAARLISSCLEVFPEEIERHENGRACLPPPHLENLLPIQRYQRRLAASVG
jgi:NADH:ubiquinone oxidoreductase subunit F (NADH-binding)